MVFHPTTCSYSRREQRVSKIYRRVLQTEKNLLIFTHSLHSLTAPEYVRKELRARFLQINELFLRFYAHTAGRSTKMINISISRLIYFITYRRMPLESRYGRNLKWECNCFKCANKNKMFTLCVQ